MPRSTHERAAELHNLAIKAHAAAAAAHLRGDHMAAHELSQQALEHALFAQQFSVEAQTEVNRRMREAIQPLANLRPAAIQH